MASQTDQLRRSFGDQFEPTGSGQFLYRKNQKGAPIPVTADERDRFIADYSRRIRYSTWGMFAVTLLFLGGMVVLMIKNAGLSMVPLYVGIGVILVGFVWLTMWFRGAPAR